ncbi:MAG TPA: hypothetical protein VFZ65_02220 [Planctomycetota bacterium]|nr:hypothetical protein [Planctomycetota bacterium]
MPTLNEIAKIVNTVPKPVVKFVWNAAKKPVVQGTIVAIIASVAICCGAGFGIIVPKLEEHAKTLEAHARNIEQLAERCQQQEVEIGELRMLLDGLEKSVADDAPKTYRSPLQNNLALAHGYSPASPVSSFTAPTDGDYQLTLCVQLNRAVTARCQFRIASDGDDVPIPGFAPFDNKVANLSTVAHLQMGMCVVPYIDLDGAAPEGCRIVSTNRSESVFTVVRLANGRVAAESR